MKFIKRFIRIIYWYFALVFRESPSGIGRIGPIFALELAWILA